MKEIKEVKNLFTFQMEDATADAVDISTNQLTTAYQPLKQFTADDVKAAYNANKEDLQFIDFVMDKLPYIRSKGVLVTDETVARMTVKRAFVRRSSPIAILLRKLADKLDAAYSIAMSELYNAAAAIQDSVASAARQPVEGMLQLYNDIDETKLRAARAAETRKKTEAAKNKADKEAAKLLTTT